MKTKVEAVNKLLLAGEPGNVTTDEHAGYTGYRPQAIIDAMNEIFFGEWGFSEVGSEIVPGDKGGLAVAQVQVWLAGVEFKPTSWGQNRVTRGDIGDARKGAQTDAIKKALSYFSIGNRAYQGLLKEDASTSNTQQNGNRRQAQRAATPAPQPQSEALHTLIGKAKQRAWTLKLATDKPTWEALLQEATGEALQEKDLTLDLVAKLNAHLAKVERQRTAGGTVASAANGK